MFDEEFGERGRRVFWFELDISKVERAEFGKTRFPKSTKDSLSGTDAGNVDVLERVLRSFEKRSEIRKEGYPVTTVYGDLVSDATYEREKRNIVNVCSLSSR
jgi:hypothetical protein